MRISNVRVLLLSTRISPERLRRAREALGPEVKLMVDAHGALTADRGVRLGEAAAELDVTWFCQAYYPAVPPGATSAMHATVPQSVVDVLDYVSRSVMRSDAEATQTPSGKKTSGCASSRSSALTTLAWRRLRRINNRAYC